MVTNAAPRITDIPKIVEELLPRLEMLQTLNADKLGTTYTYAHNVRFETYWMEMLVSVRTVQKGDGVHLQHELRVKINMDSIGGTKNVWLEGPIDYAIKHLRKTVGIAAEHVEPTPISEQPQEYGQW